MIAQAQQALPRDPCRGSYLADEDLCQAVHARDVLAALKPTLEQASL
jgi:hypothetical protein